MDFNQLTYFTAINYGMKLIWLPKPASEKNKIELLKLK